MAASRELRLVRKELVVDLGARSYPIVIGSGLLRDGELIRRHLAGRQVCIVTNNIVAPLHLAAVRDTLPAQDLDVCILPDGEAHKTLDSYAMIIEHLMSHRHNRSTTIIALGGGVVGDVAGFVAATYQRGVAFVQMPTTLLAQVDSSVGGKTAVNHPGGKNMIGAFYQPRLVVADLDTLATLPDSDYRCGLAEVIKYGVIKDRAFFEWLETNVDALLRRDTAALSYAVLTSCSTKAAVVAADEREEGVRAILNFGHTFGHAIESLTHYECLHGDAVAIGMVMASDLSARLGLLARDQARRIKELLASFDLPVTPPGNLNAEAMQQAMGMDKKVLNGRLRLVLVRALGDVFVTDSFDHGALLATISAGGRLCDG